MDTVVLNNSVLRSPDDPNRTDDNNMIAGRPNKVVFLQRRVAQLGRRNTILVDLMAPNKQPHFIAQVRPIKRQLLMNSRKVGQ